MKVIPQINLKRDHVVERFELNGESICKIILARQEIMLPPDAYMDMYTFRYDKYIQLSNSIEYPDILLSRQTTHISALFDASENTLKVFGGWAGEMIEVHYNCRMVDNV